MSASEVERPGAPWDPHSVAADDVSIATADGAIGGFLARPTKRGSRPGIVLIHEAFGLNDHIRDLACRFAATGFDVLAPDLYAREGPPDGDDLPSVMSKMLGVPDARAVDDLVAARRFLVELVDASTAIGCIGFCSGGRQALLAGCVTDAFAAVVDCWGGWIDRATADDETTACRPRPIVDLLDGLSTPLFLVGGEEDQNPAQDLLGAVDERLTAAGKQVRLTVYPNAGHAFLADYRPTYRAGPAFELWGDLIEFFDRNLK